MPKSTTPLVVPEYGYGNGKSTIGEIFLDMAQELLIDSLTQLNQLEVQSRRTKFVRQVNKAFAVELKEEVRKKNAARGRVKRAEDDAEELRPHILDCISYLLAKGRKTNASQVISVWERGAYIGSDVPDVKTIRKIISDLPEDILRKP